jgi:hypothetical protein
VIDAGRKILADFESLITIAHFKGYSEDSQKTPVFLLA